MKVFFHHVGLEGSEADFPKTVFSDLPVGMVEDNLPDYITGRESLIEDVKSAFPKGRFNCWGVPGQANLVIKNLNVGDAFLLVKTTSGDAPIPALGIVKVFRPIQLPKLSSALWGSERFPYVFFFDTVELDYSWWDFVDHVGYKENYDPRGNVGSVADSRLERFGGPSGYVSFLLENYSSDSRNIYSIREEIVKGELIDAPESDLRETLEQLNQMDHAELEEPQLESDAVPVTTTTTTPPRTHAFRLKVRQIYGGRCAICTKRLTAPDGKLEVQSAHVYPKSRNGSDDPRNGVSLCRLHHWAFDVGWLAITDELTVMVRPDLPQDENYDFIASFEGQPIVKPLHDEYAPHPLYLREHRRIHGFEEM